MKCKVVVLLVLFINFIFGMQVTVFNMVSHSYFHLCLTREEIDFLGLSFCDNWTVTISDSYFHEYKRVLVEFLNILPCTDEEMALYFACNGDFFTLKNALDALQVKESICFLTQAEFIKRQRLFMSQIK